MGEHLLVEVVRAGEVLAYRELAQALGVQEEVDHDFRPFGEVPLLDTKLDAFGGFLIEEDDRLLDIFSLLR